MKLFGVGLLCITLVLAIPGCHSLPNPKQLVERHLDLQEKARQHESLLKPWNPFKEKEILSIWKAVSSRVCYRSDGPVDRWQSAEETYNTRFGDCEDQNTLLVCALLAEGYSAAVVVGTTVPEKHINHAWVLLYYKGKEYYLDATRWKPSMTLEECEISRWTHWRIRYIVRYRG